MHIHTHIYIYVCMSNSTQNILRLFTDQEQRVCNCWCPALYRNIHILTLSVSACCKVDRNLLSSLSFSFIMPVYCAIFSFFTLALAYTCIILHQSFILYIITRITNQITHSLVDTEGCKKLMFRNCNYRHYYKLIIIKYSQLH